MKKILILLVLLTSSIVGNAQDLIVRTNGDTVKCTITKEDSLSVYFKMKVNSTRVKTSLARSDIKNIFYETGEEGQLGEEVTYRYGKFFYKRNRINRGELSELFAPNALAYKEIRAANNLNLLSLGFVFSGLIVVGTSFIGDEINNGLVMFGVGLSLIAIPIALIANKKTYNAIGIYNQGLKSTAFWDSSELNLTLTSNGLGLTLTF